MSLVDKQWEFLLDVANLISKIEELGLIASGGELWRTKEQQEIYLNTGRSQTMNSKHLSRLAIDLNFFRKDGDIIRLIGDFRTIQPIGEYWESLHDDNVWGGNWQSLRDLGHFQKGE